jgi:hypothetical protein
MKAFFIFQGRGNGVVFVAHLSRPLLERIFFRHFYGVVQ